MAKFVNEGVLLKVGNNSFNITRARVIFYTSITSFINTPFNY
jgi:hypothetical protein